MTFDLVGESRVALSSGSAGKWLIRLITRGSTLVSSRACLSIRRNSSTSQAASRGRPATRMGSV